ncbi:MAG: hypothetical protein KKE44_14140 [Proteobacteria bacterium]|nr:hypothetical protein [Pseudomonadota bacterium]MBU1583866.1 hypothetical protein [Pseudomonadota bacterium]MBU2629585.1 hypothetical protein [Pseudomonadota bacterium]
MKKFIIAGGVLLVAVAAVVFLTLSNLGPLVKKTVNTLGPKITKTDVTVADVSLSFFSGEANIKGFFLGNPKGFKSGQAMKVGSIFVDIDESSITKNPIIINKIEIVAPEITYEKISGSDNIQTLLKNVQGSKKAEEKAKDQTSSDGEKQGKKIVINNVIVKDGKVNLTMAALGGKEITAPLPDIHLKDIGKEKNGATPADAFEQIFSSLYNSISADSVTQVFNDGLKQLGNLKDLGASGLQTGGDAAQKAATTATEGVKSATKGLKGLFKKD